MMMITKDYEYGGGGSLGIMSIQTVNADNLNLPIPTKPPVFNCKYCSAGLLSWLSRWSITLNDEYTLYMEEEEG